MCLLPGSLDCLNDIVASVQVPPSHYDHGAALRKSHRCMRAESARAPNDNRNLPAKPEELS
jgi:hypothetical protein